MSDFESHSINASSMIRIKEDLRELTQARIKKYISEESRLKQFISRDPAYPQRQREEDRLNVMTQISELQAILSRCLPYIRRIKSYIHKITDRTLPVACYLLFCKIWQSFQALFLLCSEGFSFEANQLIRTIRESLDLITLFLLEGDTSTTLEKWFAGDIIANEKARQAIDEFFNQSLEEALPVKAGKAGIYGGLSHYTHLAYPAMLDLIDVFERDFDFQRTAGFHYTREGSLPYARTEMEATIIALKHLYKYAGDETAYAELDQILEDSA